MTVYEVRVSDNFSKTGKCTYGVYTFFLCPDPDNYLHLGSVSHELKIKLRSLHN